MTRAASYGGRNRQSVTASSSRGGAPYAGVVTSDSSQAPEPGPQDHALPAIPVSAGALIFDRAGQAAHPEADLQVGLDDPRWRHGGGRATHPGRRAAARCAKSAALRCATAVWPAWTSCSPGPGRPGGVRFLFDCGPVDDERLAAIVIQPEEVSEYRLRALPDALPLLRGPIRRRVRAALARPGAGLPGRWPQGPRRAPPRRLPGQDGLGAVRAALPGDEVRPVANWSFAWPFFCVGRFEESEARRERLVDLASGTPSSPICWWGASRRCSPFHPFEDPHIPGEQAALARRHVHDQRVRAEVLEIGGLTLELAQPADRVDVEDEQAPLGQAPVHLGRTSPARRRTRAGG